VSDPMDEQVDLLDRTGRIGPSSREISVVFDCTSSSDAWPDELTGTIIQGLTDVEALILASSEQGCAELYVTSRVIHEGPRKRYLLTDLRREAPGHFFFTAKCDFDRDLRVTPK